MADENKEKAEKKQEIEQEPAQEKSQEEAGKTKGAEAETGQASEEKQQAGQAQEADEKAEKEAGAGQASEAAEKASSEDEAIQTKYLRLMADFQNFKRRTEKEKSDIYAYANEKIVNELLGVMDNFERALTHGTPDDAFTQGMEMIFKQLGSVLEKAGVAEIEAMGLDFDPNFHNAVMTEESTEYESGKVSAVLQKGYTLHGKVIRPSMVKVVS